MTPLPSLLSLLVVSVALGAQQHVVEPRVAAPAETFVIDGADYRLLCSREHVTFERAQASMRWRAVAAGRDGAMATLPEAAPRQRGALVSYDRGVCVERYERRAVGVEQSFVFDVVPPGEGDLVVRLEVATGLPLVFAGPDGLSFGADAQCAVRWGGVTGISADGRRAGGTIRSDGAGIELRLPAEFVAGAALPLVLDPIIGAPITTMPGGRRPDLATRSDLDPSGCLVTVGGVNPVTLQRVGANGAPVGAPVSYLGAVPAVASITARNHYVMALIDGNGIVARSLPATSGGPVSSVTAVAGGGHGAPDLGGELTSADDHALLIFRDTSLDTICGVQVTCSASGALSANAAVTLATASVTSTFGDPRISKTGGQSGRYLIAYEVTNVLTGGRSIACIVVNRNFLVLGTLSLGAGRNPDVDGDGNDWVVAFERDGVNGDSDVYAAPVGFQPTPGVAWTQPAVPVASLTNVDERDPAVGWIGSSAVVAWERSVPGATDTDVFVGTVDWGSCANCEPTALLVNSLAAEGAIAIAGAPRAGTGGRALLAWEAIVGIDSDVSVAAFAGQDGELAPVIGGAACGAGGRAVASCARVGYQGFQVRLRDARASALAWLVLSPFATDLGCGPCHLVADPFDGFVALGVATSGNGATSQQLPIPNSAALSGASLIAQWIVAAPAGTGACSALDLDFSSAMRIQID